MFKKLLEKAKKGVQRGLEIYADNKIIRAYAKADEKDVFDNAIAPLTAQYPELAVRNPEGLITLNPKAMAKAGQKTIKYTMPVLDFIQKRMEGAYDRAGSERTQMGVLHTADMTDRLSDLCETMDIATRSVLDFYDKIPEAARELADQKGISPIEAATQYRADIVKKIFPNMEDAMIFYEDQVTLEGNPADIAELPDKLEEIMESPESLQALSDAVIGYRLEQLDQIYQ